MRIMSTRFAVREKRAASVLRAVLRVGGAIPVVPEDRRLVDLARHRLPVLALNLEPLRSNPDLEFRSSSVNVES